MSSFPAGLMTLALLATGSAEAQTLRITNMPLVRLVQTWARRTDSTPGTGVESPLKRDK